jgi:hypothetical protein
MPSRPTHSEEDERASREAALDRTIESSFPASDPPSSIPNPDDHAALERQRAAHHPNVTRGRTPTRAARHH